MAFERQTNQQPATNSCRPASAAKGNLPHSFSIPNSPPSPLLLPPNAHQIPHLILATLGPDGIHRKSGLDTSFHGYDVIS